MRLSPRYALVDVDERGSVPRSQPVKCRRNCIVRPGLLHRSRGLLYYSAWLGCTALFVLFAAWFAARTSSLHYAAPYTQRLRSLALKTSAISANARLRAREAGSRGGKSSLLNGSSTRREVDNDVSDLRDAVNAGIDVDRAIASATRAVAGASSIAAARPDVEHERALVQEKAAMEAAARLAAQSVEAGSARSAAVHSLGAALGKLGAKQEDLERHAEDDAERAAALPAGSDPDKASLRAGVEIKLEDVERIGSEQRAIVEKIASVALES